MWKRHILEWASRALPVSVLPPSSCDGSSQSLGDLHPYEDDSEGNQHMSPPNMPL